MKSVVYMSEVYRYGNSMEFRFNGPPTLVNGNIRCKCNLLGANGLYVSASLGCLKTRLYRLPKPCSFRFRCNFSHRVYLVGVLFHNLEPESNKAFTFNTLKKCFISTWWRDKKMTFDWKRQNEAWDCKCMWAIINNETMYIYISYEG